MAKEMQNSGVPWEMIIRVAPWAAAAALLLAPLAAMQFTSEVNWTLSDFIVGGVLLFGAAGLLELAMRVRGDFVYRLASGLALGASLFLIWVILAVGVIGDSGDRTDLMYGAVLAVGIIGAIIARLRPTGMARTLVAMAVAQGAVALIALFAGLVPAYNSAPEILAINGLFVVLFVVSGLLFLRSGRGRAV